MMSCSNEVSRELPMLRSVNWKRTRSIESSDNLCIIIHGQSIHFMD
jgi:hypothetical protein